MFKKLGKKNKTVKKHMKATIIIKVQVTGTEILKDSIK